MTSFWNTRFQDENYIYGTEPNAFLSESQKKLQLSGDALAIAEGEGRNAVFLAEQGMDVTAWDYAESGLRKTEKLAASRDVTVKTELVDLHEASWKKDQWDEIVCIFGHFPKELRRKTLLGVKEAVKPGGFFVAEVYSIHQIPYKSGGPQDLELLYSPEEFLQIYADWRIVHFFMGEVVRHEGDLHNGLSHVIQFIGQKR
ncbi:MULTISPECIES: class I SAM-dependent methyltransferase [Bacillus]|uniref:Methyltransferase domain-containing protein n=1 Tax=Bacillus glycinifermentans TaxID=1664069 RepID=A0AAJ4D2C4_9BACI|nr:MULTISPECIES: class I SAM-dependent methyltransferase [Bacillus]KKB71686.1 tellurite resistance methyltransferase TehB [Bacillus sp. TH008]MBU8785246.1 class I SAM-dependent methyltransferase [Bacillus glycinifermentans]MDU0069709.1 class I SAM-dependent methyltransferase [Bacillus sp. IG6]MED8017996.1 class I SAM-dependent methyltransferase [Bacillus glycinifermentans]NUJ15415.1 methyltransferase domain-containing protein [Bacillus glycinifermentans]